MTALHFRAVSVKFQNFSFRKVLSKDISMLTALTAGVIFGLSAGLAPGPLLTFVITQTLKHNTGEGIKVAAAPLITDLPIIALSLFVLTKLADFNYILGIISCAGGLYILYLAYECVHAGHITQEMSFDRPQSLKKGSIINFLNPHPYLFWITVGAPFILKTWFETPIAPFLFIAGFYVLLVGSKVILALIVGRYKSFLTGSIYVYIMRGLAGVLALFALFLFKDSLQLLGFV